MNFQFLFLHSIGNEKVSTIDVSGSLLLLYAFPLFASLMHDSLSWYKTFRFPRQYLLTPRPCVLKKYVAHVSKGILSLTPTNSASVELVVLGFCLICIVINAPVPREISAPMYDFMSLWTTNDASTLQQIIPVSFHPSSSGKNIVSRKCLMTRPNFFLSSNIWGLYSSAQKRDGSLQI